MNNEFCCVCGMECDRNVTYNYEGEVFYFCSPDCKQEFKVCPESYV